MNLKYLTKLKNQLVTATDFAPVMNYFMTEFGNERSFMRKGKSVLNKRLEAALEVIAKEMFPKENVIIINNIRFVEIAEYHFTHGGCVINGHFATLFYFADAQMGLLAVALSTSGLTQLARFTGKDVERHARFSPN